MSRLRAAIVPVTPLQQNCTLLWDDESKRAWVIDPGGDVKRIRKAIDEQGLFVERILLTHGHIDHAGGAAELRDALLGIPLEGPGERDAFLLDDLETQGRRFGIDGARNVRPNRFLAEGAVLTLADHRFEIVECPGHTPGHIAFIDPMAKLALVGDVIFRGSVGRTDFPYGDTEALLTSIRDKILTLPDDIQFICGHGPGSTIGVERKSNPYVSQALNLAKT